MKNLRNILVGLVGLLFVLQIAFVSPASAQTYNEAERERLAAVMNPNANVEEFRTEMSNYLTELENVLEQFEKMPAVSRQFDKNGLDPIAALQQARAGLAEISLEDLTKMRAVYAKFPGWREGPRVINSIINPTEKMKQLRRAGKNGGIDAPNVITPDGCPDLSGTPSFADIAITEGFQIAADAVMEGFPTDALTILARLIPITARAGLKAAVLAENTLRSQYDDCHGLSTTDVQGIVDGAKTAIVNNDNSNRDTILTSLSSSTTSINNNVTNSKNEVINNDNGNKTMLTTAISNAVTAINNSGGANTTAITTAITNAQTSINNNVTNSKNEVLTNATNNTSAINTNVNNTRTSIINNDNANTTALNTNINNTRTSIINNDNTNTQNLTTLVNNGVTQILNTVNTTGTDSKNLLLRTQIEAALASTDNEVSALALYATPASLCFPAFNSAGQPQAGNTQCGLLELVRAIVRQSIDNISQPYRDLALREFTLGENLRAAGYYKKAYVNYRKAYQMASVVESIPPRP